VQNDRFTEAAQESRADKSQVINFILSAIIILGITIGRARTPLADRGRMGS
jgi:hypothetical protein